MASIRKLPSGSFRAEVARQGVRKSKVFPTKTAAKEWAARQEYLILNADEVKGQGTLGDAMERYARERSPQKRGARWEIIRLEKLRKDSLAKVKMADLRASDIADWRDRRSKEVAPASVIREMQLISSVLTVCVKEWGLISHNPASDVRKPTKPPARSRLPTDDEMERLAISAGDDLTRATARAFHAFRFACETAMRAGEIVGLTWDRIDTDARVAHLPMTKNGSPRDVPLSKAAMALLEALPRQDPVFGLTSAQLDVLWRKLRDRAGVEGLNFHDSRAAGTGKLAKKVDVLSLARITGHRDLKMLMVYYRETAADLAKRLD
uniref:tyrosine-type recombinase/integrase n=1 Tax=Paracoccus sp. TRP TaxID=412597 RepID=UPI000225F4C6|nr:site-specific integrase [Paracoccus sp. TRP]